MKKALGFCLLVIALIVSSCESKKEATKLKEIPVKFERKEYREKLSNIVSSTSYIQLETRSDFIIGAIDKLAVLDKIYCMQSNKINVCDLTGKALFEINHFGKKGPEGYGELSDFQVDTTNNLIDIWDRGTRKIIRFNSSNGSFINTKRFNVYAYYFILDQGRNYYFYSNYSRNPLYMKKDEKYQLLKFNEDGKFLDKFLKMEILNKRIIVDNYRVLYSYNGDIYLNPAADNFVYILKKDKLSEIFKFNFGRYELKDTFFEGKKDVTVLELNRADFAWNSGSFREYRYGYAYCYSKDKKYWRGFLSKTSGNNFGSLLFENDFDGGYPIVVSCIQDDIFFTSYEAPIMKDYYLSIKKKLSGEQWEKFKADHSNFSSICEKLSGSDIDNPVIVLMTPKEF